MVVRKFCRVLQLALCTGLAAACAVQPGPLYTAVQAAAPAVGGTPLAVIRHLPETGEVYIPYSNLHCMLLYGYDEDYYYLCDPLYGYQMVEKARFSSIYEQMGRRAMTLDGPAAIPARNAE